MKLTHFNWLSFGMGTHNSSHYIHCELDPPIKIQKTDVTMHNISMV